MLYCFVVIKGIPLSTSEHDIVGKTSSPIKIDKLLACAGGIPKTLKNACPMWCIKVDLHGADIPSEIVFKQYVLTWTSMLLGLVNALNVSG